MRVHLALLLALPQYALPLQIPLQPVPGDLGAVASESRECTGIGKRVLGAGGNAVDAMIATTFCVGVVAPYHSGIGGGGFALVRTADGQVHAIDFRETAPAAAYRDMFKGNVQGSIEGGLAAAVPGEIRGLALLHSKFGHVPWGKLLAPAYHLARNGFNVNSDLIRYINRTLAKVDRNFLVEDESWAQDFAPNGELVKEGQRMKRLRYAQTLKAIGEKGPDAFYTGEIAQSLINTIQATNGTMTLQDLTNYKAIDRAVLNATYRDFNLYSIGAPAGGAISLNIMKIMEHWATEDKVDLSELDVKSESGHSNTTLHRFIEAMRFAYAARSKLGDPDFVTGMEHLSNELLHNKTQLRYTAEKINDNTTLPIEDYGPGGYYAVDDHGTSHIVTADKCGMAVSLTTTVNLIFGALIMDNTTGIVLNNEMNDFSIPGTRNEFDFFPSVANYIEPGKRPVSSISPIIVTKRDFNQRGGLFLNIGAAGGSRIISATTQVLWRVLQSNMNLGNAIREPRLHDQLMPNELRLEYSFDNQTAEAMRLRGHNISYMASGISSVQALNVLEDGKFRAWGEPRQRNSLGEAV